MGLDTTHDCWHGPYSMFNQWREELHRYLRPADCNQILAEAWDAGVYDDQTKPINVLMNHSDCEGEISADICGPLADDLERVLAKMAKRGMYDIARPATERFITGLRLASSKGESVGFH